MMANGSAENTIRDCTLELALSPYERDRILLLAREAKLDSAELLRQLVFDSGLLGDPES